MAKKCCICGRTLNSWIRDYPLSEEYQNYRVCADCAVQFLLDIDQKNPESLKTAAAFLRQQLNSNMCNPDVRTCIEKMAISFSSGLSMNEQKQKIQKEAAQAIKNLINIPVTTTDLDVPYDTIGPIMYNTTNKGVFISAYEKLLIKYREEPFRDLLKMPKEQSATVSEFGRTLLSVLDLSAGFEGSVGQKSFDNAFYICVAEMKLRCAEMGGNAIVGLHINFELDTTNYGAFYLQMYGTAVKIKE